MTFEVIALATGLDSTETTTTESATASVGGGRSTRRKTSHLKVVPETLELRESLRARCQEVASHLDPSVPMTKDEMEQVARRTLEEADLPEGYLGWMMVMLSSAFWRDALSAVPPERRLFLLPHCLKHAEGCPADYDQFGMNCKECGACSIADFRGLAEEMVPLRHVPERAVAFDELSIVLTSLDEKVQDAIQNREVTLRVELQIVVGKTRAACAARADVNQAHVLTATPAVHEAREEDGMHLCRVVAP